MDLLNFKCSTLLAHNQPFFLWQNHKTIVNLHILADSFILVKYLGISETPIKNTGKAK